MTSSATIYSLKDQSISNIVKHKDQYFDYLLVLDFEATCQKGQQLKPQEIIEFPCALLNTRKGFEVESIFHKYVRPVHHPILTEFCTELTGITQDMVNEAEDFESVFRQFRLWVEDELALINPETNKSSTNDINKFTFVICGCGFIHLRFRQSTLSPWAPMPTGRATNSLLTAGAWLPLHERQNSRWPVQAKCL